MSPPPPPRQGPSLAAIRAWARAAGPSLALGAIVLLALGLTVAHDPARGVTWSEAPFTDEGWNVLNARNLATLGTWSTDDWNRQDVTLPYSLLAAAVFGVAGVGIVQARLISVVCVVATAVIVGRLGRRVAGPTAALLGAIAFATSAVVLYYGQLAFIEPLETLLLAFAWLTVPDDGRHARLRGVGGGLLLAAAIGSKPIALFPTVGLLVAIGLLAWRRPALRAWLLGASGAILVSGIAWIALIWLPNRHDVGTMTTSWFGYLATSPREILRFARAYLAQNDDAVGLVGPLLLGAAIGVVAAAVSWRRLPEPSRVATASAIGWLTGGLGILFLVDYNPNRYLLPLAPPLAVLTAIGVATIAGAIGRARSRSGPIVAAGAVAAAVALAVALAGPGLAAWGGWLGSTGSTLPSIQARFREAVPPGVTVAGALAPILAMRTSGPVVFSLFGMNPGDLYATRGVRWVVLEPGEVPAWAGRHPTAWAGRRLVLTTTWGPHTASLYELP